MGPKQFKAEKHSLRHRFKSLFRDDQSLHPPLGNPETSMSRPTSWYGNADGMNTPQPVVSIAPFLVSPRTRRGERPVVPQNPAPHLKYPSTQGDIDATIREFQRVKAESEQERLCYTNRYGKEVVVAEQVAKFLKSLEGYASIVDVAVQHSPAITALVWAGARFILKVALNHIEYMETLESAMATIVEKMAVCKYYATIYADTSKAHLESQALQGRFELALPRLYEAVLAFVEKAKEYFDSSKPGKSKIAALFKLFSVEVQPLLDDISEKEEVVRECAEMAIMEMVKRNSTNYRQLDQMEIVLNDIKTEMGPLSKFDEVFSIAKETRDMDVIQDQHLSKLQYASDAAFNSALWQHEPRCLDGTRVDLMQQIWEWCNDPSPETAPIYWLCGMAGTGKSTISRTLSEQLDKQERLGASFFFSKGHAELSNAKLLLTTIAFQLSIALPALRPHISEVIAQIPDILQRGLSEQWQHLICRPLSTLRHEGVFQQPQPHILLIDALDECEGDKDIQVLLELLSQMQGLDVVLRVFITSRPELPIGLGFKKMAKEVYKGSVLHEIEETVIQEDISLYFRDRLRRIRQLRELPEDWPAEEDIRRLCQSSDKLFIYAATVCRFIEHAILDPIDRLCQVLGEKAAAERQPTTATRELDVMYLGVLKASLIGKSNEDEAAEISRLFRNIVGVIVLLFDTLPSSALARLLDLKNYSVNGLLRSLGSVMHASENDNIRILHPSFRDFLIDDTRCTDPCFLINAPKAHEGIFLNCLKRMSTGLRRDICSLERPGVLRRELDDVVVKERLSPEIQYACNHWVHHLKECRSEFFQMSSSDLVLGFFQTHFLHWLEALSLMRKTSEGVFALEMLLTIMTISSNEVKSNHTELLLFLHDARRFLLKNRPEIEKAPLQVYCSALLFSPTRSRVRCQYQHETPPWIEMKTADHVTEDWDPLIQVCEGHYGGVSSVAFSPDGKLFASASNDNTVRLWDPFTGACRSTHKCPVTSVAFSPDGRLLATGSIKTVRIWDPLTGVCQGILEGHSSTIYSVAFSPDRMLLASGSNDKTIKLWNPFTGACQHTLEGHSRTVFAVAFSPDGNLLASASYDTTIRLWDPFTGASQRTLEGHSTWVMSLAFSPDGTVLASASNDKTVMLWDPFTGACHRTLNGHSDNVNSVAFSPDGTLLASASTDSTLRLWDPLTGLHKNTLKNHSSWASYVAFSPDGKLLVSASDMTVRLWDPFTVACYSTLEAPVTSVAFSPDGQLLASASGNIVRLWVPSTGACQSTLTGHISSAKVVAFSPDGKLLASGSNDKTIRLWDPFTGACQSILNGHSSSVTSIAFSPDGNLIASASHDKTIRLWDPFTGSHKSTLEGHFHWVLAVAFSVDGKLIASASFDHTVRLWDPFTGACQSILNGHSHWVNSVAFSPDGNLLASASSDCTVRLWNVLTTKQLQLLNTSSPVSKLTFSIDGSYLETDQGNLAIDPTNLQGPHPRTGYPPSPISVNGDWIHWGAEQFVLLPVDMRPRCLAIRDNILAMGYVSGRVMILAFDIGLLPPPN